VYQKSANATSVFKAKGGKILVWYDSLKWTPENKPSDPNKFTFSHKDGDIYGMVISERIEMPLESLKKVAVSNALSAAPDTTIISEEYRNVNGKNILCMVMKGTIEGIQFVYYGYYYAGKAGTIQLLTYTSQNLFAEYKSEMTELLNGLTINDQVVSLDNVL
jgi:hypothetical protein